MADNIDKALNGLGLKTDSLPNDWMITLINPQTGEPAENMTIARFAELFLNNNKIWTANNDGVDSGLDANLLNGKNQNKFAQYGPYTTNNVDLMGGDMAGFQTVTFTEGSNLPYNESGCLFFGGSLNGRAMQIFGSYIRNKWYVRGSGDSLTNKHTSWREIVFKDELSSFVANSASALTETIVEKVPVSADTPMTLQEDRQPAPAMQTVEHYEYSIQKMAEAILELQKQVAELKA